MPIFEVQHANGRVFDVEASDAASASATVNELMKNEGKPEVGLGKAVADVWADPSKPVPGQIAIPLPGGRELRPSLISAIKGMFEGIQAPGKALQGDYNAEPPENPGWLSETDVARQRMAETRLRDDAFKLGGTVMTGAIPGGILGAPKGALGVGAAQPGVRGAAQAAPDAAAMPGATVEAASRINVPIPRFLHDENRWSQGLAAGLKNIPGAGDDIAKAAEGTRVALGEAADVARAGYGTGSPAMAGGGAKDALTAWIEEGAAKVASRVYDKVDDLVKPVATELKETTKAAQKILAQREASKIPGESAAVNTILRGVTEPGGLPYHGIKGLRSFLGEMTPTEMVAQGLKAAEVKQLYAAMTQDLRASVLAGGGPKALTAFNRANSVYEKIVSRKNELGKIIGTKGDAAPEAVFARLLAMAGDKSSANVNRLVAARKAMGDEAWNEVASAILSRIGRDAKGEFSIDRFITAYGKMSNDGKRVLFRSTGRDDVARHLDDIFTVTKRIQEKLEQFANPSGTGRSLTATGTVLGILHSPIKTLSTIIGGKRLAKVLAEPMSARATANWLKAYHEALVAPHAGSSAKVQRAAEQLASIIVGPSGAQAEKQLLVQQMITGAPGAGTATP